MTAIVEFLAFVLAATVVCSVVVCVLLLGCAVVDWRRGRKADRRIRRLFTEEQQASLRLYGTLGARRRLP